MAIFEKIKRRLTRDRRAEKPFNELDVDKWAADLERNVALGNLKVGEWPD